MKNLRTDELSNPQVVRVQQIRITCISIGWIMHIWIGKYWNSKARAVKAALSRLALSHPPSPGMYDEVRRRKIWWGIDETLEGKNLGKTLQGVILPQILAEWLRWFAIANSCRFDYICRSDLKRFDWRIRIESTRFHTESTRSLPERNSMNGFPEGSNYSC